MKLIVLLASLFILAIFFAPQVAAVLCGGIVAAMVLAPIACCAYDIFRSITRADEADAVMASARIAALYAGRRLPR